MVFFFTLYRWLNNLSFRVLMNLFLVITALWIKLRVRFWWVLCQKQMQTFHSRRKPMQCYSSILEWPMPLRHRKHVWRKSEQQNESQNKNDLQADFPARLRWNNGGGHEYINAISMVETRKVSYTQIPTYKTTTCGYKLDQCALKTNQNSSCVLCESRAEPEEQWYNW